MITIKMDESDVLSALMGRVKFWTQDQETIDLFEKMYDNYINGGCFEGCELNVMNIVDDDYINWCGVISKGDDDFEKILEVYQRQGLGDCSCDHIGYSYIEAVDNEETPETFLVRS